MRLELNLNLAEGYKSPSQRARRVTEGWFADNMYCPACPSGHVVQTRDNTRVVDFVCPGCGAEFQLKAKGGPFGRRLRDAAYEPMMERVLDNRSPHFAFLRYDRAEWYVRKLLLVPGHFITPAAIERCKPLTRTARRAGWVGCNILLDAIAPDGRLAAVSECRAVEAAEVRRKWGRFTWLARQKLEARGWAADVLRCVRTLGDREFALQEMYAFEQELGAAHPNNRNIRAKIRQQLQILRDQGVLKFLGRARYVPL